MKEREAKLHPRPIAEARLLIAPAPQSDDPYHVAAALEQARAARREQLRALDGLCECDHVKSAHDGEDHSGPCSVKLCRKWGNCAGFRPKR